MAASFAGVLGFTAFFAEMFRAVLHGSGLEGTIPGAIVALFGFAALGFMCGGTAEWILRDAVAQQVAAEVAASETPATQKS